MNAAAARQWFDHLSKGVTAFFLAAILVAGLAVAVRAFRGERPTKEIWDALLMSGVFLFAFMPEFIPHSKVPSLVGMVSLIAVWLWRLIRSRRRRQ